MPNDVTVNRELGIIEVKAYGTLVKEEILKAITEIHSIHKTEGIDKVLADATKVEAAPGTLDTFEIFANYPKGIKQAVLLHRSQPTGKDAEFIENVSLNRGRSTRVFDTRDEALEWLFET